MMEKATRRIDQAKNRSGQAFSFVETVTQVKIGSRTGYPRILVKGAAKINTNAEA